MWKAVSPLLRRRDDHSHGEELGWFLFWIRIVHRAGCTPGWEWSTGGELEASTKKSRWFVDAEFSSAMLTTHKGSHICFRHLTLKIARWLINVKLGHWLSGNLQKQWKMDISILCKY